MISVLPCKEYIGFDDRKFMVIGILIISVALYPILFGVQYATYIEHIYQELPEAIIITTLFWTFFRFLIIKLRRSYPEMEQTQKRILVLMAVTVIGSPLIGKLIGMLIHGFYDLVGLNDCLHPNFLQEIVITYFVSLTVIAIYEAIYFFVKYREAILEKERLHTAHVQSELDNLRNQINPHFLFNSLNTLMNIIPRDSDRAMAYLDKLSKFYRYSVGKHEESLVPIQDEIENAKLYAALLHERFGENINIKFSDGLDNSVKVVPLSLQLLIENAVKHNIVSRKKPLLIDIFVSDDGEYIHIQNNLQKKIQEVSSTGVGLKNITKRFAYFTDKAVKIHQDKELFDVAIPVILN